MQGITCISQPVLHYELRDVSHKRAIPTTTRSRGRVMSAIARTRAEVCRRRTPMLLAASVSCLCSVSMAQDLPRDTKTLEEVLVTAQRREERLQEVPISISVVGGPAMDKSTA